jgi:hypothetical protein
LNSTIGPQEVTLIPALRLVVQLLLALLLDGHGDRGLGGLRPPVLPGPLLAGEDVLHIGQINGLVPLEVLAYHQQVADPDRGDAGVRGRSRLPTRTERVVAPA